jgi:hypothetical protein
MHFSSHGKSLRPVIHIIIFTEVQQHNKNATLSSTHNSFIQKIDAHKIDQNLSSCNTVLIPEKKQTFFESPIKLGLSTLSHWSQRFKI